MTREETTSPTTDSEEKNAIFRRLLLARQLYLHGLDHSHKAGALNKMIAVHNFHNAAEMVLRAVLLHYHIRTEKQLNLDFESMLNEIDKAPVFTDRNVRLPYRREMVNLNGLRNWVQHHAIEPETSTMEYWRVFTRRFLERACETYFEVDFGVLSPLDMVDDLQLRELLRLGSSNIKKQDFKQSLTLTQIAFELSSQAILAFLPHDQIRSRFVEGFGFVKFEEVNEALTKAAYYAALLSSGLSLVDYKRLLSCTPWVQFALGGTPHVQWGNREPDPEEAKWAHDFVTQAIVHWQVLGLAPGIPEWCSEQIRELIENGGMTLLA